MLIYDPEYYAFIYSQYAQKTRIPLLHYLISGWKDGCNPGPGFNTTYYLEAYPEVAKKNVNPLVDFENRGQMAQATPFPLQENGVPLPPHIASHIEDICYYLAFKAGLFDPEYYRARYKDLEDVENVLTHYRSTGWKEGRRPSASGDLGNYAARQMSMSPTQDPLLHLMANSLLFKLYMVDTPLDELEANAIEKGIFDPDYYKFTYPDAHLGNSFYNFLTIGLAEQRNPSATFNVEWYVDANPEAGQNPIGFYLEAIREDTETKTLPDFLKSDDLSESMLVHCGDIIKWELSKRKLLDPDWYLDHNPDIDKNNALEHFGRHGWREKRDCGPNFSCDSYAHKYLANNRAINPYCHYVFGNISDPAKERDVVKDLQEENDLLFEQLHTTQVELERMRERLKSAGSDKFGNFLDPSAKDKRIAELEKYQKQYKELSSSVETIQRELADYKDRYRVLTEFFHDQMRLN